MLRDEKRINKRMYDYNAGGYCGVIMPEHVMKKIAKINCKYQTEVRKILEENKGDLLASDWTLANEKDGDKIKKQITIKYAIAGEDVSSRIALFKAERPIYIEEFFIVESREEADLIAGEVLAAEIAAELDES